MFSKVQGKRSIRPGRTEKIPIDNDVNATVTETNENLNPNQQEINYTEVKISAKSEWND